MNVGIVVLVPSYHACAAAVPHVLIKGYITVTESEMAFCSPMPMENQTNLRRVVQRRYLPEKLRPFFRLEINSDNGYTSNVMLKK